MAKRFHLIQAPAPRGMDSFTLVMSSFTHFHVERLNSDLPDCAGKISAGDLDEHFVNGMPLSKLVWEKFQQIYFHDLTGS